MGRSAKPVRPSTATKQTRDPEATKAQILDAAEEEFARYGLSGARTEAIASKTGVTKAMIYYYFGSKEGLYEAVLQRPATEIVSVIEQLNLNELPPTKAMEKFIRAAIAHEAAHPYQQMTLFQEASQNQGKYFKTANWQMLFEYAFRILERGMAEGCFRKVDPWFAAIQMAGVCNFYFTCYDNMRHIVPGDWDFRNPEMLERHTQEAIAMILGGLRRQEPTLDKASDE